MTMAQMAVATETANGKAGIAAFVPASSVLDVFPSVVKAKEGLAMSKGYCMMILGWHGSPREAAERVTGSLWRPPARARSSSWLASGKGPSVSSSSVQWSTSAAELTVTQAAMASGEDGDDDEFLDPGDVRELDPRDVGMGSGQGSNALEMYPGERATSRPFHADRSVAVARPLQFPPPGHGRISVVLVGTPPVVGLAAAIRAAARMDPRKNDTRDTNALAGEVFEAAVVHQDAVAAHEALLSCSGWRAALDVALRSALRITPFFPERLLHGMSFVILMAHRALDDASPAECGPGSRLRRGILGWVARAAVEAGCRDGMTGIEETTKHCDTKDRHAQQHQDTMHALRGLDLEDVLGEEEHRMLGALRESLVKGVHSARSSPGTVAAGSGGMGGTATAAGLWDQAGEVCPEFAPDTMPLREQPDMREGVDCRTTVERL